MLAGLPFATAYLDDIVVVSRSPDGHRRHLHDIFDRLNEYGFCVCLGKCFFQPSIKCHGFIVDKYGCRPDTQKVTAVADITAPTNITTPRSFLVLINDYQSFAPNVPSIRKRFDDLLKKNNE